MMPNQMSPVERAVLAQQSVIEEMAARIEDLRGVVLQTVDVIELMTARMDLADTRIGILIEQVHVLVNERVYMLEANVDQLLGRDDES